MRGKEPPKSGLEQDVIYGRQLYCYLTNVRGIRSYTKNLLNRRRRRRDKVTRHNWNEYT